MEVTYENLGIFLDKAKQSSVWSKEDRTEFRMFSNEFDAPTKGNNFYDGAQEYLAEVRQGALRNRIADKLEQLKEDKDKLPWER